VIFLAGLQDVPEHLYEASKIDGAGVLSRFRHVTVPLMTPMIFFTFITGVIGTLGTFTGPFIMTQGGPGDATMFYGIYLYNKAFVALRMGYASGMAWVMFIVVGLISAANFYLARYWVYYEAG
jgi:multiple sugar transport system permease protein